MEKYLINNLKSIFWWVFSTKSAKKIFEWRFKKVVKIYLEKDFTKITNDEDKKVILYSFLQEYFICVKLAIREMLIGEDYKSLRDSYYKCVDEKYEYIRKCDDLEFEIYKLKQKYDL